MKYHTRRLFFFDADTATGGGDGGSSAASTQGDGGTGTGSLISDPPPQTQGASSPYFNAEGAFADGWIDKLPEGFIPKDDHEAFKTHVAKYKNPLEVIKSDFNKERMLGKRGVFIPGEGSTPEEVAAFRKAIGVPESADGYNLKPEKIPDGLDWNDDLVKPYAEIAHKYNIPAKAMQELVAQNLQTETLRKQQMETAIMQDLESGRAELKQTYGSEFDAKINLAKRAAASVGVDPTSRGFLDPAVVKGFVRLAEMIDEDRLPNGDSRISQGGMARAKDIMTNPSNPYHHKYQSGDEDTVAMVRSLMQQG